MKRNFTSPKGPGSKDEAKGGGSGATAQPTSPSRPSLLARMMHAGSSVPPSQKESMSPDDKRQYRGVSSGPNSPRSSSSYRRTMLNSESDVMSDRLGFLEKYSAKMSMLGYIGKSYQQRASSSHDARGDRASRLSTAAGEDVKKPGASGFSALAHMWPFQTGSTDARIKKEPLDMKALGLDISTDEEVKEYQTRPPEFVHTYYKLTGSNKLEPKDPKVLITAKVMYSVLSTTTEYVSSCLRHYYRMREVYVPSRRADAYCTVLITDNWQTASKLLVIVSAQPGCPMGIWSRSLCVEQGLRHGSMLPYVDTAIKHDFAVIICNPLVNAAAVKDPNTGAMHKIPIQGSSTPEDHVTWVYDNLMSRSSAEHVFLLGFAQGGALCKNIVERAIALRQLSTEAKAITGVALVESVKLKDRDDPSDVAEFLGTRTCNWMRSQLPTGRPLSDQAVILGFGSCVSLGSSGPEGVLAWSLYLGMKEVFAYLARTVSEKRSPKLRMPNLKDLMGMGMGGHKTKRVLAGAESESGSVMGDPTPRSPSQHSVSHGMGRPSSLRPASTNKSSRPDDDENAESRGSMSLSTTEPLARRDSWVNLLDRSECLTVNDFHLEKVIGKGAFGKVLMVRLVGDETRTVYAMKVINKSEIIKRGYVESTKLERSILCEADHPYVVHLRYAFQNGQKLYLVTDFYNGGNLLVHLKRSYVFSEPIACFFAAEVFTALEYLHDRNIVYRDLKPENVLMENTGHIALTDFGLSKHLKPGQRTSTFCGTAEYLAPEQLRRSEYNHSVDWWAFGVFTYEMLMGRSPFYNRSRTQMYERIVNEDPALPTSMSPDAQSFVLGLLTKNPAKRLGNESSQAIRSHPFFSSINWRQLLDKETTPPIDPECSRASDCRYISSRYLTMEARDSAGSMSHLSLDHALQRFTDFTFCGDDQLPPSATPGHEESEGHTTSGSDMTASSGRSEDFYYEQSRLRGDHDGGMLVSSSPKPAKSPSRNSAVSGAKSPTVHSPLTPCTGQAEMNAPHVGSPHTSAEGDSKMVQSPPSPSAQSQPSSSSSSSSMIQSPKPPSQSSDASQVKQG